MSKIFEDFDPYQQLIEQQIRIELLEQNFIEMHKLVKQHQSAMMSQQRVIQELMQLTVLKSIQGDPHGQAINNN